MKKILIVDGRRLSSMLSTQFILSMHADWIIEHAATGEEAIDRFDSCAPDLILLEVNMPDMGGFAAVEKLREKIPTVHISLLTANVQDATQISKCIRRGFC